MSSHKFCHNCGKQVSIASKFCAECGTGLSSLSNVPEPQAPPKINQRPGQFTPFAVDRDDDDEDGYLDRMEHAVIRQQELHVEIVKDRPLGESMGSIVAQSLQGGPPLNVDPARPPQYNDSSQYMAEFKKEAGTSREKP